MKKGLYVFGAILFVANVLIGLIATSYETFNWVLSSVVIIATIVLLGWLSSSSLKDAFKISLSFLFSFLGLVEYILAIVAPSQFADNWYLIVIIGLIVIESLFVIASNKASEY
ncbi:MAG: hypothetical protein K5882_12460 [Bacteroidales bacterium]|nr:hypothetical protein [Bacteroidales bacterium]